MNKLYLIGNGFDLAHGLKTKYSDFILWYINKIVKLYNQSHSGSYTGELMDIVNDGYNFKEHDSLDSLIRDLEPMRKGFHSKSNLFGRLLMKLKDLNWVDIEYEYYLELLALYRRYYDQFGVRDIGAVNILREFNACLST